MAVEDRRIGRLGEKLLGDAQAGGRVLIEQLLTPNLV